MTGSPSEANSTWSGAWRSANASSITSRSAAGGKSAEAQPGQLVRRRAGARVHGDAAGNRRDDDLAAPQPRRRGPGELHEHRALGAFDSGGERGSGEHDRRTAYMPRTTHTDTDVKAVQETTENRRQDSD